MRMRISVNIGFVTNSSSCVHHFPGELLQHPKIKAFMEAFEIAGGFIGPELWHRSHCTTVAITKEQKAEVQHKLTNNEYDARGPAINVDTDEVVIIYGDEYSSIATALCDLMYEALVEKKGGDPWSHRNSQEYN